MIHFTVEVKLIILLSVKRYCLTRIFDYCNISNLYFQCRVNFLLHSTQPLRLQSSGMFSKHVNKTDLHCTFYSSTVLEYYSYHTYNFRQYLCFYAYLSDNQSRILTSRKASYVPQKKLTTQMTRQHS